MRRLGFGLALATLFTVSVLVFVVPEHFQPLLSFISTLLLLYSSGPRRLTELAKVFAVFAAPFTLLSLLFQIATGLMDLHQLLVTLAKIYTLFIVSAIAVDSFSAKELLAFGKRLGVRPFLALLLAIKLLKYSSHILADVHSLYVVNLGHLCRKSIVCRARLTTVWIKAFSQLFIVKALEVGEAMFTRYKAVLRASGK